MPLEVTYPSDTATRVEGVPFYDLAEYTLTTPDAKKSEAFCFRVRAFRELPLCDAVCLLIGDDQTGHIIWSGALAMIEWLVRGDPSRGSTLLTHAMNETVLCVELGCGCGAVTVALAQYLQHQCATRELPARTRVQLLCTDGNESCVELARANIREFCSNTTTHDVTRSEDAEIVSAADVLEWGECYSDACETGAGGCRALLTRHGVDHCTWSGSLYLLSADVIYTQEAIPLLIATAQSLHRLCSSASRKPTTWWILYAPRSLTLAANVELFETLLAALTRPPEWRIARHALPPGSVVTGFEAYVAELADTVDKTSVIADALLGCVLEVSLG